MSPDATAETTRPRRPGPLATALMALGLLVGSTAALMATNDMGFTRDESFYFHYGESYQGWFTRLGRAETPEEVRAVMSRDGVVPTWSGNFEHPPLMKTAFGWSWWTFARKDRGLSASQRRGEPSLSVQPLGLSDGFEAGAEVALLAPLRPGQHPTDGARVIGRAVVAERGERRAALTLTEGDAAALAEACKVGAGDPAEGGRLVTGCQAREDRALAVFSESDAMRLPGALSGGLSVMLTFLLGLALFNWWTGVIAALAFLWTPHHFFHAHLICFDMPIVAGTLATLYAFWKARSDRRWALGAGVMWGIALLIKHNAFFLPFPLLLFWLWTGRDRLRLTRQGWRLSLTLPPLPLSLLVMPVVAFTMLFVFWPKLWYDPYRAVADYFAFHLLHEHYMQQWFGEPLQVPPFPVAFPFVWTIITVPEVFQFLWLVGFAFLAPVRRWGAWLRGLVARGGRAPVTEREKAVTFTLLNGLIPIMLIALPSVPIFGGVKHWMTAMPFLMLLAGYGLTEAIRLALGAVQRPVVRRALAAAAVTVVFAHPVHATLTTVPHGTAYFNPLVAGGPQGAADALMQRTFWGHSSRLALDYINAVTPKHGRVFFQNTTHTAYVMYQRDGLLRGDIRYHGGPHGADLALCEPQSAFHELDIEIRQALGVAGPVHEVLYQGVSQLRVYARPGLLDAPAGTAGQKAPTNPR